MKKIIISAFAIFQLADVSAQWQTYTTYNSAINGHPCWFVNTDSNGDVLVSTMNNGLNKFDGTNWSASTVSNSSIPSNVTTVTFVDGSDLWIGTDAAGMARLSGSIWTIFNTSNSSLPDNRIYDIDKDAAGNIWIGTRDGGLAKYNGTSFTTYSIFNQLTANFNRVHNLVIDSSGIVWMGLSGGGLGRLNPQTGLMNQYATWNSALVNDDVYSLTIAPDGKIWCGTFGGISVFNPQTGVFTSNYTMSNSQLPSNYIRAIDFDDLGYCWIGTGYGGVARLSPFNSFTVWNENNSNLQSDSIWSVHVTSTSVWVATITEGVATLNLNIKNGVQSVMEETLEFSVFPNPASENISLVFNTDDASLVQIQLFNSVGQLVMQELWVTQPGENRRSIEISNLSAGSYYIELVGSGKSGTQKIIID